jgi:hypothetical protein
MVRKLMVVGLAMLIITWARPASAGDMPEDTVANSTWLSAAGLFTHGSDLTSAGLVAAMYGKHATGRFEYQYNTPFVLLMTEREETWRFSFQGPVNLGVWGTLMFLSSTFGEGVSRPVGYLLLLPNSEYRVRVARPVWLGIGCETQYFFARVNDADRGMLVTPYLGMTLDFVSRNPDLGQSWWRLSLSAGHASYISFDGPDSDDGATVRVEIIRTGIFD